MGEWDGNLLTEKLDGTWNKGGNEALCSSCSATKTAERRLLTLRRQIFAMEAEAAY